MRSTGDRCTANSRVKQELRQSKRTSSVTPVSILNKMALVDCSTTIGVMQKRTFLDSWKGSGMATYQQGFPRPTTTPTPDEIFDRWLPRLTGAQLKVLLYIVRRTFGFGKNADAISLNQICKGIQTRDGRVLDHGTGLARSTASKAIAELEKMGLIAVTRSQNDGGNTAPNIYQLRMQEPLSEAPDEDGSKKQPGVVRKSNQGSSKKQPPLVRKSNPQETGIQKTEEQETVPPPKQHIKKLSNT